MSSLRLNLLPVVEALRAGIRGGLDQVPHQLTIRTRTYAGRVGESPYVDKDLTLPRHYPVHQIETGDVSGPAGKYEVGDIIVDHITPSNGAGVGYTRDQLAPAPEENGVDIIYVLSGPHAGDYSLFEIRTAGHGHSAGGRGHGGVYTYTLILRRRRGTTDVYTG